VITTEQIKAARMLLSWSQVKLAEMADIPLPTIKRLEAIRGPARAHARTIWAIQEAFDRAGIIFIDADDTAGPGVRVRATDALTRP